MTQRAVKRWAIAHARGLYIGQMGSKREAIDEHCRAHADANIDFNKVYRDQIWRKCHGRGDRAVKVTITYKYPG